ncbi:MAG: cmpD 2 [Hyphomicrobiales bacterium]|nr:cmpD 2 [Hyphomicrobiales bacterium]
MPEIQDVAEFSSPPLAPPPLVELDRASLQYGSDTLALAETSLTLGDGEFIAVVGPSGCGKSSLLKLVSGLHKPRTGAVKVQGRIVDAPIGICGMAFQNSNLLPWRTTLENVLLPLEIVEPYASTFRRKRKEYEERAQHLLKSVGLDGFGHKYPWELSGGMQQRTSLCRALIHNPRLLLLDEPFGALDAFTREDLWNVLQSLHAEQRPTVILVTHDLREAVYLADTVYVFSARPGEIIARTKVPFARPRAMRVTYTPEFVDMVQHLRDKIHH